METTGEGAGQSCSGRSLTRLRTTLHRPWETAVQSQACAPDTHLLAKP